MVPCTAEGKEYTEHDDMFVDNPNELIGKDLNFMVKLLGCRGLPSRFNVSGFYCSKFYYCHDFCIVAVTILCLL